MICSDGRVLASTRRFVVALLLALPAVVLTQMPAHACTCVNSSVQRDAARADLVFTGVLVDSTSTRKKTTYDVRADTVYQGILTNPDVQVVTDASGCGLGGLKSDKPYVFFVSEDGGDLVTDQCSGTSRATDKLTGKIEKLLGPGKPLDKPEPTQASAEFILVEGAEPETFTRLAAPGGALVLIGLLGLFVVRRRAGE